MGVCLLSSILRMKPDNPCSKTFQIVLYALIPLLHFSRTPLQLFQLSYNDPNLGLFLAHISSRLLQLYVRRPTFRRHLVAFHLRLSWWAVILISTPMNLAWTSANLSFNSFQSRVRKSPCHILRSMSKSTYSDLAFSVTQNSSILRSWKPASSSTRRTWHPWRIIYLPLTPIQPSHLQLDSWISIRRYPERLFSPALKLILKLRPRRLLNLLHDHPLLLSYTVSAGGHRQEFNGHFSKTRLWRNTFRELRLILWVRRIRPFATSVTLLQRLPLLHSVLPVPSTWAQYSSNRQWPSASVSWRDRAPTKTRN